LTGVVGRCVSSVDRISWTRIRIRLDDVRAALDEDAQEERTHRHQI
jgi:hypothetical protein